MREPLHFNQSSPPSVVLPLLLAAPLFGAVALALLAWGQPEILSSRWHPSLIAGLHLYTLGFLGCSMLGAVLQILPVLSGSPPLRSPLLARLVHLGMFAGVPMLAIGLHTGHSGAMRVAAVLLACAIAMLFLSVLPQFRRPSRRASVWGILFALTGFAVAASLGLRLLAGWGFDAIGIPRQLTDLHAGWAMIGWVAALVFAVVIEVVPMFQFTRAMPKFIAVLPVLLLAGIALASFSMTRQVGLLGIAACLGAGALIVLQRQWRRPHGRPDTTFHLFRIAMLSLLAAIALFFMPDAWFATRDARRIAFTLLFLVGFAGSCVMGMLLKIVPFLVRLHLQRELWNAALPARNLPAFAKLLPAFPQQWIARLQAFGVACAASGILAGWTPMTLAGLLALACTALLVCQSVWQVAWLGKRIQRELIVQSHAGETAS